MAGCEILAAVIAKCQTPDIQTSPGEIKPRQTTRVTHLQGQHMICRSSTVHMTQFLRSSLVGESRLFARSLLPLTNASHAFCSGSRWPETRFLYLRRVKGRRMYPSCEQVRPVRFADVVAAERSLNNTRASISSLGVSTSARSSSSSSY